MERDGARKCMAMDGRNEVNRLVRSQGGGATEKGSLLFEKLSGILVVDESEAAAVFLAVGAEA
jgi:hypothetical protein